MKTKYEPAISPSITNAAARLNVSKRTVKMAKRTGCLAFNGNGTIKIKVLADWLAKNHQPADSPQAEIQQEGEMAESERRSMVANMLTRELRLAKMRESLVETTMMRRDFTRMINASKIIFGALPRRLGAKIASMTDPIEIQELMRAEIVAGLAQLSSGKWPAMKCKCCQHEIAS